MICTIARVSWNWEAVANHRFRGVYRFEASIWLQEPDSGNHCTDCLSAYCGNDLDT